MCVCVCVCVCVCALQGRPVTELPSSLFPKANSRRSSMSLGGTSRLGGVNAGSLLNSHGSTDLREAAVLDEATQG